MPSVEYMASGLQRSSVVMPYSVTTCLLAALMLFAPLIEGGTTHFPAFVMRTIIFLSCLAWIVSWRYDGVARLRWSRTSAWILSALGLAAGSILWAPYTHVAMQWVVTLAMYIVFYQMVSVGVASFRDVRMLVMMVLGMGAFQAVIGIFQCLALGEYRAHGTFFNPNFFATYEAAVIVLAGAILCYSSTEVSRREKGVLAGIVMLAIIGFLAARSRGALIALVPVLSAVLCLRFGKRVIPLLLCCAIAFVVVPNPIRERALEVSSHDPFAYTRLDMWANTIDRIVDQPWGSGPGMYKYVSFQSRFPIEGEIARFGKRAESPHNEYLQTAAELGIAGLLIVLTAVALWIREAKGVLAVEVDSQRRGVVVGLMGIVSAFLIHAAVDSVFHEPALVMLAALAAGLVLAIGRTRGGDDEQRTVTITYTTGRATMAALVVAILLVLTIQPAAAWYAYERGNEAVRSGDLDGSLPWYQGAISIEPWDAAYHNALATSELALFYRARNQDWLIQAVDEMKQCVSLNPLDGRGPFRLGTLYQLMGETAQTKLARLEWFSRAVEAYRVAVQRDPYSPYTYVVLGKLQYAQGDIQGAKLSFSRALEYEPNFLPARAQRIKLNVEMGNGVGAREEYMELLRIVERFKDKAETAMERQFLDVDLDALKGLFKS